MRCDLRQLLVVLKLVVQFRNLFEDAFALL
jgi:hypothetical protein